MRRALVDAVRLLPLLALAGCGPGTGAGSPQPGLLAYRLPEPNPVAYAFADTARFAIESGPMGTMRVVIGQEGRADLLFSPSADGFDVAVRFPRLRVSFATPAQGEERADAGDLGGPIGVRLSPAGRVAVIDTPAIAPALAGIVGPESLVRPLFVHLPDGPVAPGGHWVDTVRTEEETGGTRSIGESVITTTVVGDTMVAGRPLLLFRTVAENVVEVSGVSGGVEVRQRLTGSTHGRVVWDPRLGRLVSRQEEGELSGTLAMPGMEVEGLPVRGTVRRRVTLVGAVPAPAP